MVFIDMQKCFDKLWLEDGLIEMWKNGTDVNDAVVLKKMNERSAVTIRTPVGETNPINLTNIVRQGTVSGPDICCSSTSTVNHMGRKLVTFYGPDIEIGAPVFVDDINTASDVTTANDLVYNCSLLEERKKMNVNTEPDKSAYLPIRGRNNEPEEELTEMVKNGWIKKVKEYKLLGTWMNEEGNYFNQVEKMTKKVPLMSITTKQIGNPREIGKYAMTARLKLIDRVCMLGILHGAEAVPNLSEEMDEIEKVQHKLLCEVFGLPLSTPYMPLLMELGIWTMNYRIQYKKMMLYHNILQSEEKRTMKRIAMYQREEGRPGTWVTGVIQSMNKADIDVEPEDVLKSKWKKEVKSKLQAMNEKEVTAKTEEMRKGRTVCKDKYGRKQYMEMEIGEALEILKMRLHMMPLPCNYGQSGEGCRICSTVGKVDTEHYLKCGGMRYMRKKWGISDEAKLETDDTEEMKTMAKYMRQVCTLLGTGKMMGKE
jgi:hypothetical protein